MELKNGQRGQVLAALCAVGMYLALDAGTARAADLQGDWRTPYPGTVRIAPCGDALCGHVIAFDPPAGMTQESARDVNNPDPDKRDRPILGIEVLSGLKQEGGTWRGRGYDPERGIAADATVTLNGEDKLTIRGCILYVLCENVNWTRVP
ncbi:DUF2147 domain-containing protein [Breoghania sp. L-A4]|uniref:DUF2147 domain-containing protein n=1 Tax=Breoghania sp. L-A4 TaxID=2304600 RepID=UPI000E35A74A|nr:DUF2147 domain-containing protein [Breoghania sp. L-A4]AXS40295.1 DUF2147 domain-containing protein [Breoghania sp. L-A4]